MEEVSNNRSSNKRLRSDPESPEAKRIRADVLDFLAYDDNETDSGDLAGVMQSLQEEISLPAAMPSDGLRLPDLGYLLEASDDELGLPPTVLSPSGDAGSVTEAVGEVEEAGYGQAWGFGDEFYTGFYDDLDFGIRPEAADGVVMYEDGLFDDFSGAPDFFEAAWQSEWLPAL